MAFTKQSLSLSFDPEYAARIGAPIPVHREYVAGMTTVTLTDHDTGRSWPMSPDEAELLWSQGENAVRAWIAAQP